MAGKFSLYRDENVAGNGYTYDFELIIFAKVSTMSCFVMRSGERNLTNGILALLKILSISASLLILSFESCVASSSSTAHNTLKSRRFNNT
jgi:hypothetical protein